MPNIIRTLISTGIGLSLFCLPLAFAQDKGSPADSIAVIEDRSITVGSFKAEMERLSHGLPGGFGKPEQREELLTGMVRSEMAYVAALKEGYDRKPEVLEQIRRLIINQYRKEKLDPALEKVTVPDEEITAFYNAHQSELATAETRRAAVIRISIPKKATDEAKTELMKRAEAARAEALKLGPDTLSFGSVAVNYSDDQVSRYRGGDTGLLTKTDTEISRWGRDVMDIVFALKVPGEVSPVISGTEGYYLVKLMEIRQSAARPVKEVREIIRNKLYLEKKGAVEKTFYDGLALTMKVKVNNEVMKTIEPPAAGKRPGPPALPGK